MNIGGDGEERNSSSPVWDVQTFFLSPIWDVQTFFSLSPVWDVQHLAETLSIPNHLVHQLPAFVVVGGADHKLFNLGRRKNNRGTKLRGFHSTDLFKLMHPEDAPSVPPMAPHLETNCENRVVLIINSERPLCGSMGIVLYI